MLSRDIFRDEVNGVDVLVRLTDGKLTLRTVWEDEEGIERTAETEYPKARILELWDGLDDIENWGKPPG